MEKDRLRLDIQIECCGIRPKPRYTFEVKRLRDDDKASVSDSLGHYLGNNGVGRFVAGRYDSDSPQAAMLGLIQAHDADVWLTYLSAQRNELRHRVPLREVLGVVEL